MTRIAAAPGAGAAVGPGLGPTAVTVGPAGAGVAAGGGMNAALGAGVVAGALSVGPNVGSGGPVGPGVSVG